MAFITVIFGVLLIIGGISCMFTPVATFMSIGYYVAILLLVYGIGGLIKAFQRRALALEIVLSILAIILGVVSILHPGEIAPDGTIAARSLPLVFDKILLILLSCWFVIQGIITVTISLKLKGISVRWILGFIIGALGIILGVYSLLHPLVMALTAGYLISFYFIEAGLNMITLALTANAIKKELKS